ncbi:16S rRNA (guanine(527)-N(7))-methyltransferase RsmG [Bordetella sp. N]|uniref:16S rRNA (guanine(527)-N(7))-methyltransferase RsmG n=1 Tax=Bordetella sp. N TaxID=1746199 RepID=UPI00070AB357|nr:16S rRNA (guanine(527)-N(7))-methyltransferase RsmG [Bordetella sp. N]ALM85407.1 16S rRNA (guanine(527)-N(7))-methyltransferase RsmG [Bordetella sp. N]
MSPVQKTGGLDAGARLRACCEALGLSVSDRQVEQLLAYLAQLQRWNRTYNLTALRDPDQMLVHHVFDSLAVVAPLDSVMPAAGKLFDIGAGAGLPGVILAIMRPTWRISCVDAVEKKTAFIRQMTGVLGLANLQSVHARVEQLDPAGCDVVTSRAFASLRDFADLAGRHVADDGTLVALKGKSPDEEIAELQLQGAWRVENIQPITVPELDAQRCLIWMRRASGSLGTP